MLDLKYVTENSKEIKRIVKSRGVSLDVDNLIKLIEVRGQILKQVEDLRAQRNKLSRGKPTPESISASSQLKSELKNLEPQLKTIDGQVKDLMWQVPNFLHPKVPLGEKDRVLRTPPTPPKPEFKALDHEELGRKLDLIDFEAGSEVAGAKFYYLKNEAALLELALINYAFDLLLKEGFTPFITPDLAKERVIDGIGFNPRGPESQIYMLEDEDLGLVGTSEITLGGYHAGQVLEEADLPLRYAGFSHCFRREAGSYGQSSKGLYRVHQFSKVEMFVFCRPEESDQAHEELLGIEEKIFKGLKIPYRVVEIRAGDLGAAAYRKFDLEAWMPGRKEWGEITSTSNTTDYQSRRLNIRYRRKDGSIGYPHTLNGTAVATSRALIAILENYQQEDGSVKVPPALVPYLGKKAIKR